MQSSIGIVELPEFGLLDSEGNNWLGHKYHESVLISKQVLLASLQAEGFDAQLVNLTKGNEVIEYGQLSWGDNQFTKVYLGRKLK